jgi:hypothetical protein
LGTHIVAASTSNRLLKNKHQAVRQGVRRFGKRSPPAADEHLQKPHNAGSWPQARFLNTLLIVEPPEGAPICAAPRNVKPPAGAERSAVLAEKPILE